MSSSLHPESAGTAASPATDDRFWTTRNKFPPKIEDAFQKEMEHLRVQRARKTGIAAMVLYAAFSLSDRVMVPDIYGTALMIRFLLVMPLIWLTTVCVGRIPVRHWREVLLASSVLVVGVSLPLIASLSRHPNALHFQNGVTLVVLYGIVVLGLRMRDAIITSLILTGLFSGWLLTLGEIPADIRFNNWLFHVSVVAVGLIASFRIDQDQRRAYHAHLREHEHNVELSEAVGLLEKLSAEDGLTRIANRREFDRRLMLEWGRSKREGEPLAIIMVDVDRFKNFNDHYGHQTGDSCLQRIAGALRAVPQRSSDLVARYGGEEFVALLPATSVEDARGLAERMRQAIADLQIPHATSGVMPYVTASFGVAALVPDAQGQSAALVAAADAALYQAKEQGRNRVGVHAGALAATGMA